MVSSFNFGESFDLVAYKHQFQTQVAVPYKDGVTVIGTDIIEYLATSPVPTTTAAGQQIVANLNSKAQTASSHLSKSVQASDNLRLQLDNRVEQLVQDGSKIEQQIVTNQQQLVETQAKIQQTQAQVQDAQNQVNAAVQSVQHAEQKVREEQDRVDKARQCRGKRFIRKITKPFERIIKEVIVKPACQVVNVFTGHIDKAKESRGRAEQDLSNQRNRLAQFQAQLGQLNTQQASLQQARVNLEAVKTNLNGQLTQTVQTRDNVQRINVALKTFATHILSLSGKSQVLKVVVEKLIDMETVITPLSAIAEQIISYTGDQNDINQLNAIKQKITTNLPLVKQKLPQYALIPLA